MTAEIAESDQPITLGQWKRTICPTCEYVLRCPKRIDNLRLCRDESLEAETDAGLHELIKKTIRRVCNSQRKHRRDNPPQRQLPIIFGGVKKYFNSDIDTHPVSYSAVLLCSDKEEFKRCLS